MRSLAFICVFGLAGCGSWPDAGEPTAAGARGAWPALLPLDQVLDRDTVAEAEDADAQALSRRAAALRTRADVLRGDSSDMDVLRSRLAR